jgi:hypothetical protein
VIAIGLELRSISLSGEIKAAPAGDQEPHDSFASKLVSETAAQEKTQQKPPEEKTKETSSGTQAPVRTPVVPSSPAPIAKKSGPVQTAAPRSTSTGTSTMDSISQRGVVEEAETGAVEAPKSAAPPDKRTIDIKEPEPDGPGVPEESEQSPKHDSVVLQSVPPAPGAAENARPTVTAAVSLSPEESKTRGRAVASIHGDAAKTKAAIHALPAAATQTSLPHIQATSVDTILPSNAPRSPLAGTAASADGPEKPEKPAIAAAAPAPLKASADSSNRTKANDDFANLISVTDKDTKGSDQVADSTSGTASLPEAKSSGLSTIEASASVPAATAMTATVSAGVPSSLAGLTAVAAPDNFAAAVSKGTGGNDTASSMTHTAASHLPASPANEEHRTLQATPTTLEVGLPNGTQGWLKIRAEIGTNGVQAALSSNSAAGQNLLHEQLPAINAYLQGERIHASATVVERAPQADSMASGENAGTMSGGHSQERPDSSSHSDRTQRFDPTDPSMQSEGKQTASGADPIWEPIEDPHDGAGRMGGGMLLPMQGRGSGSWLNVLA